ncbi:MAG: ATP-dependent helicase HrpB [Bacteroidales bacterium]|nr:ATP-dependent helicase HrpB [Bacteroidales bacterium]
MEISGKVCDILSRENIVVVTAPPGAGKSTALPLSVYDGLGLSGKLLMLEPRRIAARAVAERMAYLSGSSVGDKVGYRVRFDSKVSASSVIEVLTEGILSGMMIDNPTLDGVDAVVFDEFHERSLVSDEALAMVLESQRQIRPDLKIIIMSATIDSSAICSALNAPLVESTGRMYPVDIIYSDSDTVPSSCAADVARAVLRSHNSREGDILAFLPGEYDICSCARLLEGELGASTDIFPLYGMLSFDRQLKAVRPSVPGRRKVVLATSIAETSLTIEGVKTVVDSGLCRRLVHDDRSGQSHLETVPISRDMAFQRAGRSGRTSSGCCYRLYREASLHMMQESRTPEIIDADIMPMVLDIAAWGCGKAEDLFWLTPPPSWKLSGAVSVLRQLGALDDKGDITSSGRSLNSFPCHPRIARMLMMAGDNPQTAATAADLAAIMEERDPVPQRGADIDIRLSALAKARECSGNPSGRFLCDSYGRYSLWDRILRASEQFRRLSGVREFQKDSCGNPYAAGRLLAAAFPERIGRLCPEGGGHFLLSSGQKACIDRSDALATSQWIVAVTLSVQPGTEGRIFMAAEVEADDLKPLATVSDRVFWSPRDEAVLARRQWRLGNLVLEEKPLPSVSRADILDALCEAVRKNPGAMLNLSDDFLNLQRRIACASKWHPESGLPDLSTGNIAERAHSWLPLYAPDASGTSDLKKLDMSAVLWGMLDYQQQQMVDRTAPSHITVPTGSSIRLQYRVGADAPVLRVRLQECFGLTDTPRVDCGRLPVLMELLSPGFKPVQLTSDLASFWSDTYFQVRSELRRRYPRHSWPDNPLEAPPVRGVKH